MPSTAQQGAITIPLLKIGDQPLDDDTLSSLVDACLLHGFFYLSNDRPDGGFHIEPTQVARMYEVAKDVFECSAEAKEAVNVKLSPGNRGYFTSAGYAELNKDPNGVVVKDNKEGFFFGSDSLITPGNVAPAGKEALIAEVESYMNACVAACRRVMRAIVSTGLLKGLAAEGCNDPDMFADKYLSDPVYMLKLLKYPPHNGNTDAHTDYGVITLLLPGDSGLQLNVSGAWHDVPVVPNAFVINFGDLLSFWSDGDIKSTIHRVIYRSPDPTCYRYSIPFFMHPNAGSKVRSSNGAVIDSYEYVLGRFDSTYKHRTQPAEAQASASGEQVPQTAFCCNGQQQELGSCQ